MVRRLRERVLEALLPGGLVGEARLRVSLLAYGLVFLTSVIILWLPIELAIGSPTAAAGMLALLVLLLSAVALLRRGQVGVVVHVVLAVYALVTSVTTLMGGGAGLENLLAVVLLPIFAGALSLGRRTLLTWTAISVGMVGAYWALYATGRTLPASPQADTIGFVTLMFFIPMATLVAVMFDLLRVRAIADARELNAALVEQRDKAQTASAAKSQFLTIMSHELRTPLSSVLGAADLLAETSDPDLRAEYLEIVRASAGALLDQLNVVLDYTHLDRQIQLQPMPTDVLTLCQGLVRAHAPAASKRGVALTLHAGALQGAMQLDADRLRQILYNLIANAVKFTEHGEITVHASAGDDELIVTVEDTGIGIPAERQEDIFQPFTQLDAAFSREFEGLGLGLPLSLRLAEQMGGSLTVESTLGHGSCFRLTLPALAAELAAPVGAPAAASSGTLRVLLVEDNPINQLIAERLLLSVDCAVSTARNGQDAVQKASRSAYDLILMDCMMPVIDGYEATRQIRASGGPSANAPIVALTANALSSDRQRCLAVGMDEHVPKPLTRDQMLALITQCRVGAFSRATG